MRCCAGWERIDLGPAAIRTDMTVRAIPPKDDASHPNSADRPAIRDDLLRRLAYVLLDQYGDDVSEHVEARRRACALRGDRAGVTEWRDVGRIVAELIEVRMDPGSCANARKADDYPLRVDMPSVRREWAFWVVLSVLAVAVLMFAWIIRHI